jgi:hypothetical protein
VHENSEILPLTAFEGFLKIYQQYINQEKARSEYLQFATHFQAFDETISSTKGTEMEENIGSIGFVIKLLCVSGLKSVFPQLFIVLHIALTLPVTSVSTERSFSKLKLVKTRLRMTMKEDRLEGLVIISCERDVELDTDDIINGFAQMSNTLRKALL